MRRYYDTDLFAKHLLLFPLYFVSGLFPRTRRVAFGSGQHDFNGNAKYLMLHMRQEHPDVDVAWIAPTRRLRDRIRALGLPAYWKYEPKGLLYCLTAKLYVCNNRTSDINHWTSGGAITLYLWHGVGTKALGFASTTPVNRREFNPNSVYRRIVKPWLYARPAFFLSTTPLMSRNFAKAFRIPEERCLELGYPRSDHFFLPRPELDAYLARIEPKESIDFARKLAKFAKVVLYMPTYRDTHEDFLESAGIDYARLDASMRELDALFIFKLHPWTKLRMPDSGAFPNLCFAENTSDVYPYLPYVDVLVTDYSSVYYDCLLLEMDIVLFVFDRERYQSVNRDLILDFDTYTPGRRVTGFDELLSVLRSGESLRTPEQAEVRTLVWGGYRGGASAALATKIRELLDSSPPT